MQAVEIVMSSLRKIRNILQQITILLMADILCFDPVDLRDASTDSRYLGIKERMTGLIDNQTNKLQLLD